MTRTTRNILIGLALGILTGLFLGEYAQYLRFVSDAYIRLLQMTVLPYLIVSLIGGFGNLDGQKARELFLKVGLLTLVLWAITLGLVFAMPVSFPTGVSASFFSSTLVEVIPSLDFISLYIPTNAFESLANNVVPAVVLFSSVVGIALMGVEKKQPVLSLLSVIENTLNRANKFAIRLTPLGLFAIAATTVGTMDVEQLIRIRVFLISYGAMSLLLTLWILPGLVACLTPIPARRVIQATRDALITAFITGELFVVLAILVDKSKELLEEYGLPEPEDGAPADIIIPAFYNFPHAAKVLSLSFVLFAAWYSDTAISYLNSAKLSFAGIATLFGSLNFAIPYLLDLVRVPSDTFELFLATGVINSRFGTLAAAMHMVVLALAGSYAMMGGLRFSALRILRYCVITVIATVLTLAGTKVLIQWTGQDSTYDKDRLAMTMSLRFKPTVAATILTTIPEPSPSPTGGSGKVMDGITQRGMIRVGYVVGTLPYSFINGNGELVGFDVEMAYRLAEELGVGVDFIPVTQAQIPDCLKADICDVVMGGVPLTTKRSGAMAFSDPYLDETLAFIVPDNRRADFSDAEWVLSQKGIRVGVPALPYMVQTVQREFPDLIIVEIPFDAQHIGDYFEGRGEQLDALAYTAERGSFKTLIYPAFSVAVPQPVIVKFPIAYPVGGNDQEFAAFMSHWIDLKKKDNTIHTLYDHWILGKNAHQAVKHWSIMRNVLHWVD
ncbi:MAG: cation:dicarboxylate symporter family transporter [Pyrinomonadaceae bacterium]